MVSRIYVEKKPGFDVEAQQLKGELTEILGIKGIEALRIINRYDVEGIDEELFRSCVPTVFSEPQVDVTYDELPASDGAVFAVEFLPGQFDQRADSASECVQLISQGERPAVRSAKVYMISGALDEAAIDAIKHYVVNPVEARIASLDLPETLYMETPEPQPVEVLDGFRKLDEAGLAAIGVTCTNPGVTAGNDYYFRICFLDPFQGTVLANFAQEKFSAKKAYCLGELGNEYDQGLISYFTKVFEAAGGKVITDSFPTGNSDFGSYLNKAKSEGADVIFTPVSIAYAVQIITQAASLGIEAPFLGSDTLDDNMVLEAIKGTDLQLYVSTFYQEGGSPEFDAGIKQWLNDNPDMMTNNGGNDVVAGVTAMGYDAYFTALEAVKAADSTDPAAILAALPGVHYEGVTGVIEFDDIGDAKRDAAYIKEANTETGAWEFVAVQTVEQ